MATQFSMLGIMNAALISQGFDEIVQDNDGSVEWRLLSRNWPLIVEAELEDGLYYFTKKQAALETRQDGAFGFEDAYLVPMASLHVRSVWVQEQSGSRNLDLDWGQDGERVYVNAPSGVFIEYVDAEDPSFWGANFSRGVQMKLEAVLLRVREEYGAAGDMENQAEAYFQRARTNSTKSRSATEPYKMSRFALARFGLARSRRG